MIKSIEELHKFIMDFKGSEVDLNRNILWMYKVDEIPEAVVTEYLEITQGDVVECMEEGMS